MPPDDTNNKIWMKGRIIAYSKKIWTLKVITCGRIIDCELLIEIEDL